MSKSGGLLREVVGNLYRIYRDASWWVFDHCLQLLLQSLLQNIIVTLSDIAMTQSSYDEILLA